MKSNIVLLRKMLDEERTEEFEEKLRDVILENDSNIIKDLLPLLDDDYDFQEVLFLIIHGIESYDKKDYSKGLVESLSHLIDNAPVWAENLSLRNMNNKEYFEEFFLNLKLLPKVERNKCVIFLKKIINNNVKHKDKIVYFDSLLF